MKVVLMLVLGLVLTGCGDGGPSYDWQQRAALDECGDVVNVNSVVEQTYYEGTSAEQVTYTYRRRDGGKAVVISSGGTLSRVVCDER